MAKIGVFQRNEKRKRVVARDHEKREALKKTIINQDLSFEERMAARDKLNKMDRNGAKIRLRNRCSLTGRSRGVYRKFNISRIKLRQMASKGELPGVTKSSW